MAKLGFNYIAERPSEDDRPSLGVQLGMNEYQQFTILGVAENSAEAGLMIGDVPLKVMGTDVKMENVRETFGKLHSMKVGETVNILVQRGDEEIEVIVTLQQKMDRNIFESMETTTEQQKQLREAWSKNI